MAALLAGSLWCSIVQAGLVVGATRIIYPEGSRTRTVMIGNTSEQPALIQTWVDDGHAGPHRSTAPFVTSPPVMRLKAGEKRTVSVIHTGARMPDDRESLYWLNLHEIPSVEKDPGADAKLNVALNVQMKLMYRPRGLTLTMGDVTNQMQFHLKSQDGRHRLLVRNPSSLHASLSRLRLWNGQDERELPEVRELMLAPFSETALSVDSGAIAHTTHVRFIVVDDVGHYVQSESHLLR